MADLTRRQLRYWCFRFKTEETEGVSAKDAPRGLRKKLEEHPHFAGWSQFGETWDWDEAGTSIVPLRYSLEQQWNSEAWANARDLPSFEE